MLMPALTLTSGFQSVSSQEWHRDAGEQAHRRFEDRLPALIINACLDTVTLEVGVGVDDV